MYSELLTQLQAAQKELDPQLKALRASVMALQRAIKLASAEKPEAFAMQKALLKLQQAAKQVENEHLQAATNAFEHETQQALNNLAFEFARDLKQTFEQRGQSVSGRPPTLAIGPLLLQIDMTARKGQWFYGKEALTSPQPLSQSAILKRYDRQHKAIIERQIDTDAFLTELHQAWQQLINLRSHRPAGGRINIVETYSKVVMNRQSRRFWNAPSRKTFKEYPRQLFVRDLVLARASPTITVQGKSYRLRLGVATKSQAGNPSRSIWLPEGAFEGQYYSDITFEEL